MYRHLVCLVPKAALAKLIIAWTGSLALKDAIRTEYGHATCFSSVFPEGNSVVTFYSLEGRMVSAAFSREWEESGVLVLVPYWEHPLLKAGRYHPRWQHMENLSCNECQALKIKMTKMMQSKWKLLLRWAEILRSNSSRLLAFGDLCEETSSLLQLLFSWSPPLLQAPWCLEREQSLYSPPWGSPTLFAGDEFGCIKILWPLNVFKAILWHY